MRIFLTLLLTFYIFPADIEGLRDIHVGEKVPLGKELKFIEGQGKTILLYLKSDDLRSVAFLRQFLKSYNPGKKTSFVLVDVNPETDQRVMTLFNKLKGNRKNLNDPLRVIYGGLGIVVMPSLIFIDESGLLNSVIVSYRPNLGMFFKEHLKALAKGEKPGDVYGEKDKKLAQRKKNRVAEQAFTLIVDGNYQLAGSMYKKVIENDNKDIEAHIGYGLIMIERGETQKAVKMFNDTLKNNDSKRLQFGLYLSLSSGDPSEENLTNLARFALLEPSFFPAVFKAGEILENNGKVEESIKVFKRSYKILLRKLRRKK
ncbi:MAG: hypothetical protein ABFR36_03290 [Acidobacteriota bacterium]